jgi:hypothetical protein
MDVYSDVAGMQHDFEAHEWVDNNPDKLADLLKLRLRMLNEEHGMKSWMLTSVRW